MGRPQYYALVMRRPGEFPKKKQRKNLKNKKSFLKLSETLERLETLDMYIYYLIKFSVFACHNFDYRNQYVS